MRNYQRVGCFLEQMITYYNLVIKYITENVPIFDPLSLGCALWQILVSLIVVFLLVSLPLFICFKNEFSS